MKTTETSSARAALKFGRFRVVPYRREFFAEGAPVLLGSRAFDVLMVLIEAAGELVTKDEIFGRVWPGMVVEEHSLQFHISVLRKTLGKDRGFIKTISGRGYRFVADIAVADEEQEGPAAPPAVLAAPRRDAEHPTNLPAPTSELIGREAELQEATALLMAHRLVTFVGPGGIGKTRLALEVARHLVHKFADGVWVAELGLVSEPSLVAVTVATALKLEIAGGAPTPEQVAAALGPSRLLLVLDNCEHVIDAAANMAEALLRANPAAHVIATSREPLRAEGEWIYPLPPLSVPAEDAEDADDPLRYGAVRLFIGRAQAAEPHFASDRHTAVMTAAICRQLDGIPLAIELAASSAVALGVEALAAHIDDRFHLLISGRRTALPRHQTLRATLDWSYELLAERERVVLRRLAVFAGAFSLEAAAAVAADDKIAAAEVVAIVASLVAKSLVVTEVECIPARYRLLGTTRAYALEKLAQSGEHERLARRHAEYCRDLFEQTEDEWESGHAAEWVNDYRRHLDNLRAALDWAFSPEGDAAIGIGLTAAAVPLWMHLSLMDECRSRVERALAALGAGTDNARHEMKLHAALGASLIYARGAVSEIGAAWTRAFELAEKLNDAEYQLRSLSGLWFFETASGRHRHALDLAKRFCTLAAQRPDPNNRAVGERLIGVSQHYLGDQTSARRRLEHVLAQYVPLTPKPHIIPFPIDHWVMARVFLARVLWLQGFSDQAMRAAETSIAAARAADHANSVGYSLSQAACPIALLAGDLAAAERYVDMLLDHATRRSLALWHAWGRCYQGVLEIKRGDCVIGLGLLREGYDGLGKARFAGLRLIAFQMAEALGCAGQIADGLAVVDEAINRCEHSDERWQIAELRRVKGELVLRRGTPEGAVAAEDLFRQALDWARRQGALSWELRAAMSLSRLLRDRGRSADAVALVGPVYDRFTEGFETTDLNAAKLLLDGLLASHRNDADSAMLAVSVWARNHDPISG